MGIWENPVCTNVALASANPSKPYLSYCVYSRKVAHIVLYAGLMPQSGLYSIQYIVYFMQYTVWVYMNKLNEFVTQRVARQKSNGQLNKNWSGGIKILVTLKKYVIETKKCLSKWFWFINSEILRRKIVTWWSSNFFMGIK